MRQRRPSFSLKPSRATRRPWIAALIVHVLILGLLHFSAGPADSKIHVPQQAQIIQATTLDIQTVRKQRQAYLDALKELERQKQREREAAAAAKRQAREKKAAEKRQREEQARQKKLKREREKKEREVAKKREREKKEREAVKKRKREQAERKAAEATKREETRKREEAERRVAQAKRALEKAQRRESKHRDQARELRRQADALRAQQLDAWRIAIKSRVERFWVQPPVTRYAACEVLVVQNEKGEVLRVEMLTCPASWALQESLRNAVLKASPLPRVPSPELFDRRLVIRFHPE